MPVNPLLAEPMYLNGTIERVGTGTRDIVKLCKKSGLKEPEYIQEEMFRTILWRKDLGKNNEKNAENVPEKRLNAIMELIKSNVDISMLEISKILQVNHKTIKRDIAKLKSRGILERIGADKGGYWRVIK